MLGQDLNGQVDEVYLINFPQIVPSPYFPSYAFDFAERLHLMVRPPPERGTVRPVYDRSLVDGRWPTVGEFASLAEIRWKLRQPRRIAYRFVGRPPWIIRWR